MSPEIIEISFKRNRKGLFINSNEIELNLNDYAIVEVDKGIDMGRVTQIGRLVLLKEMKDEPKSVIRKASVNDIDKMIQNRREESMAFVTGKEFIHRRNLNMKLVEVEYQFDSNKLTFYFTSDQRVDFRELVKDLASKYRTRIELRQISVREEARKLGGIGVCGKQLCCSSFMLNFSPISTNDAKEQNLPMNPSKLSGICNRLKCCLLYEKGFYSSSLKRFPPLDAPVETERGLGFVDKVDIFNESVLLKFNDDEYEKYTLSEIKGFINASDTLKVKE
jgi:cell fate regulator YaaT (PSP1 superfamily)